MHCKLKTKAVFRTIKNCMSNKFSTLEKFCGKKTERKCYDGCLWKGRIKIIFCCVGVGQKVLHKMLQKNSNEFFGQPNICVLVLCYSFQLIYILFIFRKNKLFTIASQLALL